MIPNRLETGTSRGASGARRLTRALALLLLALVVLTLPADAESAPAQAAGERSVAIEAVTRSWTGDLDGMIRRRLGLIANRFRGLLTST